jgi:hypothetical protein
MVKYNQLLLITIIGLAVIVSGCTGGQDVTSVVKALPEVQQFMNEHPNAKITVTYWSKDEVAKSSQEISQQCDKPITPIAMYKATLNEGNLTIVSWINAENQTVICSTTQGNGSSQITIPTSTPISISTPLATPVVTPTTTQTPSITATTPITTITPISTITPTDTSIPAGATAKCNDGTYSYSQHRQGTCSHHGGVNVWY